jgi:ribosomal protein L35
MHSHILTKKSPKRKRKLRTSTLVAKVNIRHIGVMLPE